VFFQVEYALSAAYQASVVLIESDDVPQEALPVQKRNVYVTPFRWPHIDQVVNQAGADLPIVAGDTLLIQGRQLRGDVTLILLENQEWTPDAVGENEVVFTLPPGLHAGVKSLQIVQRRLLGTPLAAHRGVESNAAPFVLRPTITGALTAIPATGGTDVTLTLDPDLGLGQRAVLMLNQTAGVPPSSFVSPAVISSVNASQITINIAGVPTGSYLARVQVDGAESLLQTAGGQFTGFLVNMP